MSDPAAKIIVEPPSRSSPPPAESVPIREAAISKTGQKTNSLGTAHLIRLPPGFRGLPLPSASCFSKQGDSSLIADTPRPIYVALPRPEDPELKQTPK